MTHFYKSDLWGNKVPLISISGKEAADEFLRQNRHVITQVVDVPRGVRTLALM